MGRGRYPERYPLDDLDVGFEAKELQGFSRAERWSDRHPSIGRAIALEPADWGADMVACLMNAMNPGRIATELTADLSPEAKRELFLPTHLKREGQPEKASHLVVFLASPWASYPTGQVINVDGGLCP